MVQRGLGFILDKKTSLFQQKNDHGHIEIAFRLISKIGKTSQYEQQTKWKDPVDFLVFTMGALKVGNRWNEKVITYCPNAISTEMRDIIAEYIKERYEVDEVQEPISNDQMAVFRNFR